MSVYKMSEYLNHHVIFECALYTEEIDILSAWIHIKSQVTTTNRIT